LIGEDDVVEIDVAPAAGFLVENFEARAAAAEFGDVP
jgi:hypothetical protein